MVTAFIAEGEGVTRRALSTSARGNHAFFPRALITAPRTCRALAYACLPPAQPTIFYYRGRAALALGMDASSVPPYRRRNERGVCRMAAALRDAAAWRGANAARAFCGATTMAL
jgi:hypothetical protein